jgi:ribonuclease HI
MGLRLIDAITYKKIIVVGDSKLIMKALRKRYGQNHSNFARAIQRESRKY